MALALASRQRLFVDIFVAGFYHLNMDYQRDEHRVHLIVYHLIVYHLIVYHLIVYHLIVYHLIWCPKRRKPVLVGPVAARCRGLIEDKCAEHGWEILALAIQPDHVHLFVRVWPSASAADVVKECKGVTSFALRREYPQLRKLPSMWTRSYFAATAGNVSQETIQRSIDAQTGK